MKIIKGIKAAKPILSRYPLVEDYQIPPAARQRIKQVFAQELAPEQVVDKILTEVRSTGDIALFDYTKRIDGVELSHLEVTEEEIATSYTQVSEELISALSLAAQRIRAFHLAHKRQGWIDFSEGGIGQLVRPLERVGIYVPGGTARYPSTVLMSAIPARVAGVRDVILTTPPQKDGMVSPAALVAANIAGVDRIFKVGGAQAIAALAFGTDSIPKVDKICGPGNIFVLLAKKMVYGIVDIDGLYGPTETVIIADETADPIYCAADLLAQAEHDPLASAILITTCEKVAVRVNQEVERQLPMLERREIASASLENKGSIIVVANIGEAVELINSYAPEHLSLKVADAWSYIGQIKNAGGIFIGESSPEVLVDYIAGPSHIMPTGGTACFSSPLGVDDFLKVTSLVAINSETFKALGPAAKVLARAEGLSGHAQAVEVRMSKS
jgi:histidinol dehydrogenase